MGRDGTQDGDNARARLYDVMSSEGTVEERLEQALEIGTEYFGVEYGYITDIDQTAGSWEIIVDEAQFGTVCFVSSDPRAEPFTEEEKTFTHLVAQMAGHEIERSRHQEELDRQERKLETRREIHRAVIDSSFDGIFRIDTEGRFIYPVRLIHTSGSSPSSENSQSQKTVDATAFADLASTSEFLQCAFGVPCWNTTFCGIFDDSSLFWLVEFPECLADDLLAALTPPRRVESLTGGVDLVGVDPRLFEVGLVVDTSVVNLCFEFRKGVQFRERIVVALAGGKHRRAHFACVIFVLGCDELAALCVFPCRPTPWTLASLGPALDDPERLTLTTAHDGVHIWLFDASYKNPLSGYCLSAVGLLFSIVTGSMLVACGFTTVPGGSVDCHVGTLWDFDADLQNAIVLDSFSDEVDAVVGHRLAFFDESASTGWDESRERFICDIVADE